MSDLQDTADTDQRPYEPDRTRFVAAVVLWLAAAVLTAVAAFQNVYEVGYGSGTTASGNSLDAWGTFHGTVVESSAVHGPRYAPVLIALTVLFAVLALAAAARIPRWRPARFDGAAASAGIAVTALLVGLVIALYLDVTSRLDGIRASLAAQIKIGESVRPDIDTTVGTCAYLTVAAAVCAALAVASSAPRRRETEHPAGHADGHTDGDTVPDSDGAAPSR